MTPRDATALYEILVTAPAMNGQIQHRLWAEGPLSRIQIELLPMLAREMHGRALEVRLGERVVWTPAAALGEVAQTVAALANASGNQRRACAALGISYTTLRDRVRDMGLGEWLRGAYPLAVRQPERN